MMDRLALKLTLLTLLVQSPAWLQAHPTSYKGAKSLMMTNKPDRSELTAHYSFTHRFSLGATVLRIETENERLYALHPKAGALLHRINDPRFQANWYAYGGAGAARYQGENEFMFHAGSQFDIEDRRYYFLAAAERLDVRNALSQWDFKARVGTAPYLAEFDELNSWLILEYTYNTREKNHELTPMARFFYRNVLLETGVSLRGKWLLNLMFHF